MNRVSKNIIILFIAHYLMYPFYFSGVSNLLQQLIIFGSIFIYGFVNINQLISIFASINTNKRNFIMVLIFYLFILSSSFFIPIVNGTNDMSYFTNLFRSTLYMSLFTVLLSMVRAVHGNKQIRTKMINLFLIVTRNYVIVTILFLMLPTLKNFWFRLINISTGNLELLMKPQYFARVGWTGYSGFSITVYCTIAVILGSYLLFKYYSEYQKLNFNYLSSILMALIGNTFYGRSGLLISLTVLGISILFFAFFYKKTSIIITLISGILMSFIILYILKDYNVTLLAWYNWMMEPILSILETGTIETSSTDTLWSMWFIPDVKTFLFGDGYYTNPVTGSYYMGTDVGYIRPILFFGIFFTIVNYTIPILMTYTISKGKKEERLLAFLLLITMFLFEIKGEVVHMFIPIIFIVYLGSNLQLTNNEYSFEYNNRKLLMKGYNYEITTD